MDTEARPLGASPDASALCSTTPARSGVLAARWHVGPLPTLCPALQVHVKCVVPARGSALSWPWHHLDSTVQTPQQTLQVLSSGVYRKALLRAEGWAPRAL